MKYNLLNPFKNNPLVESMVILACGTVPLISGMYFAYSSNLEDIDIVASALAFISSGVMYWASGVFFGRHIENKRIRTIQQELISSDPDNLEKIVKYNR